MLYIAIKLHQVEMRLVMLRWTEPSCHAEVTYECLRSGIDTINCIWRALRGRQTDSRP